MPLERQITETDGVYEVLNYYELADVNVTVPSENSAERMAGTQGRGETSAEKL